MLYLQMFFVFVLFLGIGCSPILKSPNQGKKVGKQENKASDCPLEFKKVSLCGQLAPSQKPIPIGKPCTFQLAFWHAHGGNFLGPYHDPGLTPHVWLWMQMPTGSHGSLPITVSTAKTKNGETSPGLYDVNSVVFTMESSDSGQEWWEFHVELKQADGTIIDEAIQIVPI